MARKDKMKSIDEIINDFQNDNQDAYIPEDSPIATFKNQYMNDEELFPSSDAPDASPYDPYVQTDNTLSQATQYFSSINKSFNNDMGGRIPFNAQYSLMNNDLKKQNKASNYIDKVNSGSMNGLPTDSLFSKAPTDTDKLKVAELLGIPIEKMVKDRYTATEESFRAKQDESKPLIPDSPLSAWLKDIVGDLTDTPLTYTKMDDDGVVRRYSTNNTNQSLSSALGITDDNAIKMKAAYKDPIDAINAIEKKFYNPANPDGWIYVMGKPTGKYNKDGSPIMYMKVGKSGMNPFVRNANKIKNDGWSMIKAIPVSGADDIEATFHKAYGEYRAYNIGQHEKASEDLGTGNGYSEVYVANATKMKDLYMHKYTDQFGYTHDLSVFEPFIQLKQRMQVKPIQAKLSRLRQEREHRTIIGRVGRGIFGGFVEGAGDTISFLGDLAHNDKNLEKNFGQTAGAIISEWGSKIGDGDLSSQDWNQAKAQYELGNNFKAFGHIMNAGLDVGSESIGYIAPMIAEGVLSGGESATTSAGAISTRLSSATAKAKNFMKFTSPIIMANTHQSILQREQATGVPVDKLTLARMLGAESFITMLEFKGMDVATRGASRAFKFKSNITGAEVPFQKIFYEQDPITFGKMLWRTSKTTAKHTFDIAKAGIVNGLFMATTQSLRILNEQLGTEQFNRNGFLSDKNTERLLQSGLLGLSSGGLMHAVFHTREYLSDHKANYDFMNAQANYKDLIDSFAFKTQNQRGSILFDANVELNKHIEAKDNIEATNYDIFNDNNKGSFFDQAMHIKKMIKASGRPEKYKELNNFIDNTIYMSLIAKKGDKSIINNTKSTDELSGEIAQNLKAISDLTGLKREEIVQKIATELGIKDIQEKPTLEKTIQELLETYKGPLSDALFKIRDMKIDNADENISLLSQVSSNPNQVKAHIAKTKDLLINSLEDYNNGKQVHPVAKQFLDEIKAKTGDEKVTEEDIKNNFTSSSKIQKHVDTLKDDLIAYHDGAIKYVEDSIDKINKSVNEARNKKFDKITTDQLLQNKQTIEDELKQKSSKKKIKELEEIEHELKVRDNTIGTGYDLNNEKSDIKTSDIMNLLSSSEHELNSVNPTAENPGLLSEQVLYHILKTGKFLNDKLTDIDGNQYYMTKKSMSTLLHSLLNRASKENEYSKDIYNGMSEKINDFVNKNMLSEKEYNDIIKTNEFNNKENTESNKEANSVTNKNNSNVKLDANDIATKENINDTVAEEIKNIDFDKQSSSIAPKELIDEYGKKISDEDIDKIDLEMKQDLLDVNLGEVKIVC